MRGDIHADRIHDHFRTNRTTIPNITTPLMSELWIVRMDRAEAAGHWDALVVDMRTRGLEAVWAVRRL